METKIESEILQKQDRLQTLRLALGNKYWKKRTESLMEEISKLEVELDELQKHFIDRRKY